MRHLIVSLIAVFMLALAGCGGSGQAPAQVPIVAGAYTAQTAHATTDVTITDAGGGLYNVVFQPTGINTQPITATMGQMVMTVSDDGKHQLWLFNDGAGRLWLDVDHIRYALHQSA